MFIYVLIIMIIDEQTAGEQMLWTMAGEMILTGGAGSCSTGHRRFGLGRCLQWKSHEISCMWVIYLGCWKNTSNLSRTQQTKAGETILQFLALPKSYLELICTLEQRSTPFSKPPKIETCCVIGKKYMVLSDDTPFNPLVHHHVSLHFTIIFPSFHHHFPFIFPTKMATPPPRQTRCKPSRHSSRTAAWWYRCDQGEVWALVSRMLVTTGGCMYYHIDWSFMYIYIIIYIYTGMMM
jgi:hypothetical protein